MNRRNLIRLLALASASTLCGCTHHQLRLFSFLKKESDEKPPSDIGEVTAQSPSQEKKLTQEQITEEMLKDARARSHFFEQDFPDDIYFTDRKLELVQNLVKKLRAVQRHVGNGNFNILGMDDFFKYAAVARGSSAVTAEEKLFLEEVFFFDAKQFGFQGDKVVHQMTEKTQESSVLKIPYTGHFLRKGLPVETYNNIIKDIGSSLILTSGVRGIVKQYHLFFEKGLTTNGNMSKASRSLAPPGYSFHGHGDFDIGKIGFGLKNFDEEFASTEEFKKLIGLGYVQIRYTESNLLGVRFEPWHIKVHMDT